MFTSGAGSDQTKAKRRMSTGLAFIRYPEAQLQIRERTKKSINAALSKINKIPTHKNVQLQVKVLSLLKEQRYHIFSKKLK